MKTTSIPTSIKRAAFLGAMLYAASAVPQAQASDSLKVFQVKSDSSNTSGAFLTIDSPFTNNKPGALLILTQYWAGVYNNHHVGVYYNTSSQKWQIINEDFAAIPTGARFNVRVAQATASQTFEFISTGLNSDFDFSVINRSGLNNNPNALLLATHYINPNHIFATYLPKSIGVFYDAGGVDKWAVYNEDRSLANATGFVLADIDGEKHVSAQTSASGTVSGDTFYISDSAANGNPNAVIFVTHDYSPKDTYHNHPVGVYYTGFKWAIFNEDITTFVTNETFNIEVFSSASPAP